MSNKLLTSVALSAMLAGSSAFLATAVPQVGILGVAHAQTVSGTNDNNVVKPAEPAGNNAAAATNAAPATADQGAAKTDQTNMANQQADNNAGGTFLTAQAADDLSANQMIGHDVRTPNGDDVGDINNLILKQSGKVEAAIIGVGGFLGIGEKNVAVPFEKIQVSQDAQTGKMKLTTSLTKDDLKAAPEFQTLEAQNANKPDNTATGATPATGAAPVAPAAPATNAAPANNPPADNAPANNSGNNNQ